MTVKRPGPTSLTNVDRVRGFNDALKENAGAKLLASQPGNYQRLQALQVMENLMQSNSQIDGVLAANDAMAVGAIEALDGANRKAQVIGINGTKEAIDAIKSGKLLASGDYNGFAQGCLGTMMAIRSLRSQPVIGDDRAEADRHHQGQFPAVRRAAGAADLPDLRGRRQARRQVTQPIITSTDGRTRGRPKKTKT